MDTHHLPDFQYDFQFLQRRQRRIDKKQALEKEETNRWIEKDKQNRLLADRRQQEELERERQKIYSWKATGGGSDVPSRREEEMHRGSTKISSSSTDAVHSLDDIDTDDDTDDEEDAIRDERGNQLNTNVFANTEKRESDDSDNDDDIHKDDGPSSAQPEESELEQADEEDEDEEDQKPLPPPRRQQRATITFTQLETDHMPARANREDELREWKLANNVPRRNLNGNTGGGDNAVEDDDDDDLSTRHPMFIKDKADELFKHGDYHAAERMYSRCLKFDEDFMPAVNNRSCCNLMLGRYAACERDCTRAIGMLKSASRESEGAIGVVIFKEKLAKLLKRRGIARAHIVSSSSHAKYDGDVEDAKTMASGALLDLKTAHATLKDDDDIAHNIAELEMAFPANERGSGDDAIEERGAAQRMYDIGAQRLTGGDFEGAEIAFTTALKVLDAIPPPRLEDEIHEEGAGESEDPMHEARATMLRKILCARCLANRASIRLQQGRYYECIDDTNVLGRVLERLRGESADKQILDSNEIDLLVRLEAMSTSRHGLAQYGLRSYSEAITSLEMASSLYTSIGLDDEALKIDDDILEIKNKLGHEEEHTM